MQQQTLKHTVVLEGIGLHSGAPSVIKISPTDADCGIVFVHEGKKIEAKYSQVVDTLNCTCIGQNGVVISTIEHLMAAFYAAGIDNAWVESSSPEMPILSGGADVFLDALLSVGLKAQNAPRRYLKVVQPVMFEDTRGSRTVLLPNEKKNLFMRFEIEFSSKVVGHQVFEGNITTDVFASQIAPCRTFCEKTQIEYLQEKGLIKGGSLENAVVLDGDHILNPEGFRLQNECVNHKVLDALGDLYTSGHRIWARFEGYKSGHYHNNELLKKLFSNPDNFVLCEDKS